MTARRIAPARARLAGPLLAGTLALATLAFTAGDLSDQVGELGARADRREQLDLLVERAGGPGGLKRCGPIRTNQPMKAMLAWRLDVRMEHLADPPRPPGTVFRAPLGYDDGPPLPAAPGFASRAREGAWELLATCA